MLLDLLHNDWVLLELVLLQVFFITKVQLLFLKVCSLHSDWVFLKLGMVLFLLLFLLFVVHFFQVALFDHIDFHILVLV